LHKTFHEIWSIFSEQSPFVYCTMNGIWRIFKIERCTI